MSKHQPFSNMLYITQDMIDEMFQNIGLWNIKDKIAIDYSVSIDDFQTVYRTTWSTVLNKKYRLGAAIHRISNYASDEEIFHSVVWELFLYKRTDKRFINESIRAFRDFPNSKSLLHALLLQKLNGIKNKIRFFLKFGNR